MIHKFDTPKVFIKHLKNGNNKAYSFLVDQYYQQLCVYAYNLIKDRFLAEDIVQNALLNCWRNRKKLRYDLSILNYLYASVYNEFVDQYRKIQSLQTLEKKYIEALDNIVEENDTRRTEKLVQLVKKEIHNLPPKCKEVFTLSKIEGLTNLEISEYLNISVKSTEAHITKAFSILRNKLCKVEGLV